MNVDSFQPLQTMTLNGRRFTGVTNSADGEVDAATVFSYHEEDDVVWADYAGGAVLKGFLVGTRNGDSLDFRYCHLSASGDTSSGVCSSRIEILDDGRIRLHESWSWESRPGSGHSVVEEVSQNLPL